MHCRYKYERKSTKFLEDNKEKSHYFFTGKIILKNIKHIEKRVKFNYSKSRTFYHKKTQRVKKQTTEWKIFITHITINKLRPRIYKEYQVKKKIKTPIEKWARGLNIAS